MLRINLKNIRKDLGLTQRKFAEIFDVPQSFISQIENGKDPMPAHWIPELTRMLNAQDLSKYQLVVNVQNEQDIINRLKIFFDTTGLTLPHIAIKVGLTQRMLTNIFNGQGKLDITILLSITTGFPHLNMNWILSGDGEMYKNSISSTDFDRITTLVDTISTLQDTINAKNETISILTERIKQLENQLGK